MNLTGNQPLREMLAAEYALGTLAGGARRRFERLMRHDRELQALAFSWSERLRPLLEDMQPVAPPGRVWPAIELRLFGASRQETGTAVPWWERVGLWRGISAAFAVVAVVALGLAMRPRTVEGPTLVRVEPRVVEQPQPKAEPPANVVSTEPRVRIVPSEPRVVEVERMPDAIATLVDPKSSKPVAVVWEARDHGAVYVKVAADVVVDDGRTLQLWMKPADSTDLVSLGVLPADAKARTVRIDATTVAVADAATLAGVSAFGLSLEPSGGSPKPTKVLGLGPVAHVAD